MDYSKLSDFEINKLVAKLRGLNVSAEQYFEPKRNQSNCVLIDNKTKPVDYCSNPSDAWPVIVENKISIENRRNKDSLAWVEGDAPYPDENPLRAAMIVYLMMQESK